MKLITKLITGDHAAFTEFYSQWDSKLYSFFYSKTRSVEDAKDLTQQAFIKFWNYRENLNEQFPPEVQLLQKAKQLYVDYVRKEAHKRQAANEIILPECEAENVYAKEKIALIKEASDRLPGRQKKIFDLHYQDGYSYKEIAEYLNISPKTVDAHLYAALKQLRKLI